MRLDTRRDERLPCVEVDPGVSSYHRNIIVVLMIDGEKSKEIAGLEADAPPSETVIVNNFRRSFFSNSFLGVCSLPKLDRTKLRAPGH
ncbi:hypothetical protein OUZ56_032015 [Daphnia magna]|uniref:Uncharacterized protein n=1 Tax=Daphnia magna TaxID=35525 RepID=A0ABQ9ZVV5_9CRUS|nr:hypothetical protein OUZ56_032015 [Daphnia magna]